MLCVSHINIHQFTVLYKAKYGHLAFYNMLGHFSIFIIHWDIDYSVLSLQSHWKETQHAAAGVRTRRQNKFADLVVAVACQGVERPRHWWGGEAGEQESSVWGAQGAAWVVEAHRRTAGEGGPSRTADSAPPTGALKTAPYNQ